MPKVKPGQNDLKTVCPQLINEWDYEKNVTLTPETFAAHSNKKAWWKCDKGHSWQAIIKNRSNGLGCPYCANKKVLAGYNDLQTTNPKLKEEWDYTKNENLTPKMVTAGSKKKAWWKCQSGHSWQAVISSRNQGEGCPYCSNKKVLSDYNDLLTVNPNLAKDWDYQKNLLSPNKVTTGSGKKVWWKCENGHSWQASISKRKKGDGCPYCSNKKVLSGYNDLLTVNPNLAKDWDYTKNDTIHPSNITANSHLKAWWVCSVCGNKWKATVVSRNSNGNGCPACFRRNQTSFPEQTIFYYVKKEYKDAINGYNFQDKNGGRKELDIYIPSIKTGIEYDGSKWHGSETTKKRDIDKYEFCKKRGIKLIRVREVSEYHGENSADGILYINANPSKQELEGMLHQLSLYIKLYSDICISRDEADIRQGYYGILSNNSIAEKFPEIAREWDYKKNGDITPDMVMAGSADYCWWLCSKGHSYGATACNRIHGYSCPYCANKKALAGYNDITTVRPDLLTIWNYEKNAIKPTELTTGSKKQVWWKCNKGHEWEAAVYVIKKGARCPICSNQKVLAGYNDLETTHPSLLEEWDYQKNDIKPSEVIAGTEKKVWWRCKKCGNNWQARINTRKNGHGCPICARKKP